MSTCRRMQGLRSGRHSGRGDNGQRGRLRLGGRGRQDVLDQPSREDRTHHEGTPRHTPTALDGLTAQDGGIKVPDAHRLDTGYEHLVLLGDQCRLNALSIIGHMS
jgi:hypothetical protein